MNGNREGQCRQPTSRYWRGFWRYRDLEQALAHRHEYEDRGGLPDRYAAERLERLERRVGELEQRTSDAGPRPSPAEAKVRSATGADDATVTVKRRPRGSRGKVVVRGQ